MTASKILFYLCLSFIIGIFFESIFKMPQFVLWIFLFSAFLIVSISFPLWIRSYGQEKGLKLWLYLPVAGFCLLFLILGILRMHPEKTIDPDFKKINPYAGDWLKSVAEKISPYFKLCQVR